MYIHKTANIYTVSEYIFMNVILAFAIFMWYGVIGIKRLTIGKFALGYTETAYLFVVLILIFLFVGIGLTIKRFRTGLNVFVNVITPMELFVILSCFEFWKTHILVALGLGFVFSVLYLILFFIADRRKPARSRREARCRTNKAIVFSRNIAVITVVCIISGDLIGMNWGTVVGPDISPASAVNEPEEWSLIAHASSHVILHPDIPRKYIDPNILRLPESAGLYDHIPPIWFLPGWKPPHESHMEVQDSLFLCLQLSAEYSSVL